jgi:hypothetical protein
MTDVISLRERYAPRRVTPLGVRALGDWRLKVYGIPYGRDQARPELVDGAVAKALEVLPQPAVTESRYGVGFLVVHDGRGENFVLVDWWAHENELHQHAFFSPTEPPPSFVREPETIRLRAPGI